MTCTFTALRSETQDQVAQLLCFRIICVRTQVLVLYLWMCKCRIG